MTKLVLIATIAVGTVVFAPQPTAAQACTEAYEKCLNDTYDKTGVARILADMECMAGYIGCIRQIL
jgi:hypothetical protein